MLPIKDKKYDYIYQRSRFVITQLTENDMVMTYGPKGAEEYLRYYSSAQIINLEEDFKKAMTILTAQGGEENIVIMHDVFEPDAAIRNRMDNNLNSLKKTIFERYTLDTLDSRKEFSLYKLKPIK